jgi:hypothetical protein
MHPFRAAVEAGDVAAAVALLSDDVVFHSPVVFKPYVGRDAVAPILFAVSQVFEDFGRDHVLVFETRVGDRTIEGSDFLHANDIGAIDQLTVMVRPLSGALALAEAMRALLPDTLRP